MLLQLKGLERPRADRKLKGINAEKSNLAIAGTAVVTLQVPHLYIMQTAKMLNAVSFSPSETKSG